MRRQCLRFALYLQTPRHIPHVNHKVKDGPRQKNALAPKRSVPRSAKRYTARRMSETVLGSRAQPAATRRLERTHLILLSVRNRIHCGMGRFCLAFFASFCLIRKVF